MSVPGVLRKGVRRRFWWWSRVLAMTSWIRSVEVGEVEEEGEEIEEQEAEAVARNSSTLLRRGF